jgi:hypothetical protein
MLALIKLFVIGLAALLVLKVTFGILAPLLVPFLLLAVGLSVLAVPVALVVLLGWAVMAGLKRVEKEPI